MYHSVWWGSHGCESVSGKESVKMDKIGDKYFCGKRGGVPYKDAIRVDPKTK